MFSVLSKKQIYVSRTKHLHLHKLSKKMHINVMLSKVSNKEQLPAKLKAKKGRKKRT